MKFADLKVRSFGLGGIHPEENKQYAKDHFIENFHIPHKVIITLSQHLGKPAKPLVKKGDLVSEGQLIGEKDGKFSANIYSSIPGKVLDVGAYPSPNNQKAPSVVIQLEGEFKKGKEEQTDWQKLKKEKIIERITQSGIVGMGGATFPTDIKLSIPPGKKVDTLIINGVECEPFLTCDYRLMIERTNEIIEGIKILKKVLNVKKVFIGIELNKKDAIMKFINAASKKGMEVIPLKVKYPQGGEKQLIKAITEKEVPSGGLPFDVGVVVYNIGTVLAVRDAVIFQKPFIERVVTVTGDIVKKPGNYKIKIGTTLKEIIDEVELKQDAGKIIFGGPMMGLSVTSLETPVTKGTCGILFLSKKQEKKIKYDKYRDCVHCSKCLKSCPAGLNPAMLSILSEKEKYEDMSEYNINDCMECGCCNYVCPANRPIVQLIKLGKLNKNK